LLSLIIKYGESFLTIPPTATNAVLIVLLPTVVMITLLLWRLPRQKQN
jgi:cytochrome c-type biogenesis protein CcmH/NrfF